MVRIFTRPLLAVALVGCLFGSSGCAGSQVREACYLQAGTRLAHAIYELCAPNEDGTPSANHAECVQLLDALEAGKACVGQ